MTAENIEKVLGLYVERVKTHLKDKLSAVYLFGSVARGDYTSDSDIDVMLVLNMDDDEIRTTRSSLTRLAGDLDLDYNVLINKFSTSRDDFEAYKNSRILFYIVRKEGVLLYNETER
jgi:predicted nucleotidyltransferase